MKMLADIKLYDSDRIRLNEQLLERLNEGDNHLNKMLYHEQRKRSVEHLGNTTYYRMMFLLEGKVFVKGVGFGKYAISPKEFILLPPGCNLSCAAADGAKYVILKCSELKSEGNISYFKDLKKYAYGKQPGFTSLPIHEKLEAVLNDFANYPLDEDNSTAIYDAIFILLRSLYTSEELVSLLFFQLKGRYS